MKKSTGILLLISFFVMVLLLVGIFVTLIVYIIQGSTPNIMGSKRLALVRVEGPIYDAESWIKEIRSYQEDSSIQGLVVRVDSPGGAVGPSQELYDALVATREEYGKVVVASFGSIAASGGYYIACGADHIVSSPGAMTGSIGVYAQFIQAKDLMEKIGINYDTVKRGEYKTAGSMHRELEPKERAMFQGVIDDTYDQFLEAVIKGRKNQLVQLLEKYESGQYEDEYPFTEDVTEIFRRYQSAKTAFLQSSLGNSASPRTAANQNYNATPAVQETASSEAITSATTIINNTTESTVTNDTDEIEESSQTSITDDNDTLKFEIDSQMIYDLTDALSNGKIYTGRQAEKLGLVDTTGSLEDAINIAARLAGIRGEPTVVEKKPTELSLLDLLLMKAKAFAGVQQNYSPLKYEFPY